MENESDQASKPPFKSAFDILEKIQELRWVMQLGCAVLFADKSVTSEFLKEFGNWANACFAIGSFFALGILKHSWLTSNNQSDWIYYPSLAEELHPKSKLQAPSRPQTIRNFEQ